MRRSLRGFPKERAKKHSFPKRYFKNDRSQNAILRTFVPKYARSEKRYKKTRDDWGIHRRGQLLTR